MLGLEAGHPILVVIVMLAIRLSDGGQRRLVGSGGAQSLPIVHNLASLSRLGGVRRSRFWGATPDNGLYTMYIWCNLRRVVVRLCPL